MLLSNEELVIMEVDNATKYLTNNYIINWIFYGRWLLELARPIENFIKLTLFLYDIIIINLTSF